MKLIIMQLLHTLVTSSFIGQNVFPNTIFSKNLSQCYSVDLKDQVSHPYKTADKISVLYILVCVLSDNTYEDKIFLTTW
jgi:hypothetical protein